MDRKIKRHENDAMSVSLFVEELRMEPFNPVLVFKPQGELMEQFPTLPREAFVLVLQTESQMAMYREYSNKILCIDATHGTNAYRFKLITCIVPDKFGQGK